MVVHTVFKFPFVMMSRLYMNFKIVVMFGPVISLNNEGIVCSHSKLKTIYLYSV